MSYYCDVTANTVSITIAVRLIEHILYMRVVWSLQVCYADCCSLKIAQAKYKILHSVRSARYAMDAVLRPPPSFCFTLNADNLATEWRRWEQLFLTYHAAAELSEKAGATQVAILLHCAGAEAQDIFSSFVFTEVDNDKKDNFQTVLTKFREYCQPRKNIIFERYKFWQRSQNSGEPFHQWVAALRSILKNCDYADQNDTNLRDRIVFGLNDAAVKKTLLKDSDLTLEKTLTICRTSEASDAQMRHMNPVTNETLPEVNKLHRTSESLNIYSCQYCGTTHSPRTCPAFGKICHKCGKRNHFSKVCRSGRAQNQPSVNECNVQANRESLPVSSNSLHIQSVSARVDQVSNNNSRSLMRCPITVKGMNTASLVDFKLDTGADANVLPFSEYKKLHLGPLDKTQTILRTFGQYKILPLGTKWLTCVAPNGREFTLLFYVIKEYDNPILDEFACIEMKLICRVFANTIEPLSRGDIEREYSDVFEGLGCFEKKYKIALKPDAKGVIQTPRKIPYSIQPKLKDTLDLLEADGIIASIDEPTEWVSNLVIVEKKNGELRICLDPRPLNEAILRG